MKENKQMSPEEQDQKIQELIDSLDDKTFTMDVDQGKSGSSVVREIISWVLVFVAAFVIAEVMNHFVIINARVPSASMESTILEGDRIMGWRFSYAFSEPERGDIVVFPNPNPVTDEEKQNYVKRIIGLPGETVRIEDGQVFINDEPLTEDYVKEPWKGGNGTYVVPEGCYFMMGDNRNNSNDARYWVNKYIKREDILGKVSFRYWPFSRFGSVK